MQIKTTMKYHFTLVGMAIKKTSTNNTLLLCLLERKLAQLLWKIGWRFLRMLGINLPYDPAIPLLGICPEKARIQKDTCTSMLIAALFTIARTCASRGAMVPASVWCLSASQFCDVLFSSPTSSWAPGGDGLCLSVISGEPGPGLVVMNTCWKNVQTQSSWPTVFIYLFVLFCFYLFIYFFIF